MGCLLHVQVKLQQLVPHPKDYFCGEDVQAAEGGCADVCEETELCRSISLGKPVQQQNTNTSMSL